MSWDVEICTDEDGGTLSLTGKPGYVDVIFDGPRWGSDVRFVCVSNPDALLGLKKTVAEMVDVALLSHQESDAFRENRDE
jgi:hypothetical protein